MTVASGVISFGSWKLLGAYLMVKPPMCPQRSHGPPVIMYRPKASRPVRRLFLARGSVSGILREDFIDEVLADKNRHLGTAGVSALHCWLVVVTLRHVDRSENWICDL